MILYVFGTSFEFEELPWSCTNRIFNWEYTEKPLKNCAYINERAYNPNIEYNRVAYKYHVYLKKGPGFSHLKF